MLGFLDGPQILVCIKENGLEDLVLLNGNDTVVFGKFTSIIVKTTDIGIFKKRGKHVFKQIKRWMPKVEVVKLNLNEIIGKKF